MKIAKYLMIFLSLQFMSSLLFAQENGADEGKRIDEILKGERSNCSTVDQGMTPLLLFETLSPKVLVNDNATTLTLQMKIIYYRCIKNKGSDSSTFSVADPSVPYKYTVMQFDGTSNTIQVNTQVHRLSVQLKNAKVEPGYPQKIGLSGNVNSIQVTFPIKKVLSPSQEIKLRNGSEIIISVPLVSETSMDYVIDSQTKTQSPFTPGSIFTWNIKLSMKGKKSIKAELESIK